MAPRSRSIDGSATFTIVTSSSNMKIAMQLASRVHHLRSTGLRAYTGVFPRAALTQVVPNRRLCSGMTAERIGEIADARASDRASLGVLT